MKKSKIIVSILLIIASLLLLIVPLFVNGYFQYTNVIRIGFVNINVVGYLAFAFLVIRKIICYGLLIIFIVLNIFLKDKPKMIFNAIIGVLMLLVTFFNLIAIIINYYDFIYYPTLLIYELSDILNVLITTSIIIYIFNSIPNGRVVYFVNTVFNVALVIAKIIFIIVILLINGGMLKYVIIRGVYDLFYILLLIVTDALFIYYFWKNE